MAIVIDLMPGAYPPKRAVVDPARASGAPINQWVDEGMIFWVLDLRNAAVFSYRSSLDSIGSRRR